MLVNCGINRREFLQQTVLATAALSMPQTKQDSPQAEYAMTLGTWPHRIYKENDGLLEPASTESFVFNLLVKENKNRPLDPLSARLAFYAAEDKVQMLELSRKALDAIRGVSIATRGAELGDYEKRRCRKCRHRWKAESLGSAQNTAMCPIHRALPTLSAGSSSNYYR
jgi:hypothetical protein